MTSAGTDLCSYRAENDKIVRYNPGGPINELKVDCADEGETSWHTSPRIPQQSRKTLKKWFTFPSSTSTFTLERLLVYMLTHLYQFFQIFTYPLAFQPAYYIYQQPLIQLSPGPYLFPLSVVFILCHIYGSVTSLNSDKSRA